MPPPRLSFCSFWHAFYLGSFHIASAVAVLISVHQAAQPKSSPNPPQAISCPIFTIRYPPNTEILCNTSAQSSNLPREHIEVECMSHKVYPSDEANFFPCPVSPIAGRRSEVDPKRAAPIVACTIWICSSREATKAELVWIIYPGDGDLQRVWRYGVM
jgi:hypothetical protein